MNANADTPPSPPVRLPGRSCPVKPRLPRDNTAALEMLSRRQWIKRFALGSAIAVSGEAWKGTVLAELFPQDGSKDMISLKISNYPGLQSDYGSMRFSLFDSSMEGSVFTVTRAPGDVFYAMSAICTHEGCVVDPYDHTEETRAMVCYCHNSVYDIQGRIISPANVGSDQPSLPAYETHYAEGILRVDILGARVRVGQIALASVNGNTRRLRLSFTAKFGGSYQVLYTPNLTVSPVPVRFSSTVTGSAGSLQFVHADANHKIITKNVWVDSTPTRGFYFIEMVVGPFVG